MIKSLLIVLVALGGVGCSTRAIKPDKQMEAEQLLYDHLSTRPSNTLTDIGNARLKKLEDPASIRMQIIKNADGSIEIVPEYLPDNAV